MLDLMAFIGLFKDVLGASKKWTEPHIAIIEPDKANQEPSVQALKAKGHKVQFLRVERMRQLKHDGWNPIIERDKIWRPTIFMDRKKELMLFHRPPRE